MRARTLPLLLATASLAITTGALAQEAPAPTDAGTDAAQGGIEDIVVTARRTSEAAQTIPIAITAFGSQQLSDANVEGIADIAKQTPNFFVQTSSADPTGVLLTIRGQSQQDSILTIESPIGVYVDGVNYIRSSNLETALFDTERVEVLRGPQGTLFGKNTTGGAINITTRQPDLSGVGGYVQASGATHDRYDVGAVLNLPLMTDKLGVRLVGRWLDNGSLGVNGLGDGIGGREQIAFRGNTLLETDSVTWAISADYTRTKGDAPVSKLAFVSPFPSPAPGTPNPAPALIDIAISQGILNPALLADPVANGAAIGAALAQAQALFASLIDRRGYYDNDATGLQGTYARTYGVSSNLAVELTPTLSFRSISAARWLKRSLDVDLDASPYTLLEASLASRAKNLSQEFQFAGQFGERLDWIVGAYFNEETGRDTSRATALGTINPANPNFTDGFVKNSSWAVFGQFNYDLTDTLRFTGGLRWTEESKELRSFNRSTPGGAVCNIPVALRLGGTCQARFKDGFSDYSYLASLDWTPQNGLLFYARTARSFKGGGQNLRGTGTVDSFAAFAPETVTDYEVGTKLDLLGRRLRINAAIFQANYSDIQRTIVQAAPGGAIVSLVTNAARARIRGGELEVTAIPFEGLTLSGSVGVNDAKYLDFTDVTGDRSGEPFQFPKYSYRLGATYAAPLDFGSLRLSVDWTWRSNTQLVGSAIYRDSLNQPAYGLLGARAALTIDSIGSEVAVFAANLANRRYAVSAVQFDNSLGFNTLYAGEPRVIGLQLTTRFGVE
jgi:iron complex outermembrane receptor protein